MTKSVVDRTSWQTLDCWNACTVLLLGNEYKDVGKGGTGHLNKEQTSCYNWDACSSCLRFDSFRQDD